MNTTTRVDGLILVEASKLSLNDKFMCHNPGSMNERRFKAHLTEVIQNGIKDFYRPKYDPSFNEDGTGICFEAGKKPALGQCYSWWKDVAKGINPSRNSRLGTESEYIAFLGVLIKSLVSEGWEVAEAWNSVCNDSEKLGHYLNSRDAKRTFELTGSREVCGFFDLGNTFKFLSENEGKGSFWLAGGYYFGYGYDYPLNNFVHSTNPYSGSDLSVGWIVFD